MDLGEGGEDERDVLVANGAVLGALEEVNDGNEAGVYGGFGGGGTETILEKDFDEVAGVEAHKLCALLGGAKVVDDAASVLQELFAQRYNLDDQLKDLQKVFVLVDHLWDFLGDQA